MKTGSNALQHWQQAVSACQQQRSQPDQEMWDSLSTWYDRWVENNDYVSLVLPRLRRFINPITRLLEIGPGSGGFTLPLAPAVAEIVAVEPSPQMRQLLAAKLHRAGLNNVHLVPARIEEGLEQAAQRAPYDLALASYSLYNVGPIDTVIHGLLEQTRHVVILLGTGLHKSWSVALHRQLAGEEPHSPPQLLHLYPVLLEMGITPDVEIIWRSINYVYNDKDELVRHWLRHFHLANDRRDELWSALEPFTERRGRHIGLYHHAPMALVWIDRERHVSPVHEE